MLDYCKIWQVMEILSEPLESKIYTIIFQLLMQVYSSHLCFDTSGGIPKGLIPQNRT